MLVSDVSPFVWAIENGLVTENQKPYEFAKHRFMIDPFEDLSPQQVTMKSAQVGWSVMAILKSAWLADRMKVNVIYVLPSQNIVKDFVAPKVDPLINSNPNLLNMIKNGKDSVSIKQIGNRFIYFRGAFSIREAISISGDVLIVDERDRCPDETVLTTYQSRLQASDYKWKWEFSNPSTPNFGVHESFLNSDQMHWFVKCDKCNHQAYMTFEHIEDFKTHFVDIESKSYKCGACRGDISDVNRKDGQWVAKYPSRDIRGYWISQMVAPWVKAEEIVASYVKDTPEFFHNFVLGLPYIAADIFVDRDAIIRAVSPQTLAKNSVCIGVDNGVEKHYVIGTPNGIFKYGKTKSWEEIENLFLMYNAIMVIDANPYPNVPKRLVQKYPGRVFINYYVQDRKGLGIIRFKEKEDRGVVNSDRTKLMDNVANRIVVRDLQFALRPSEMEEYIYHWENTYRVVEEDGQGVKKGKWLHKTGKPDHLCLAKHTSIQTSKRPKSIQDVKVGDLVLTRKGYKPVTKAWLTSKSANTLTIKLSNGYTLTGTGTHPILIKGKGWVALQDVRIHDKILVCPNLLKKSYLKVLCIVDILLQNTRHSGAITTPMAPKEDVVSRPYIERFGNLPIGKYLKATSYITKTITQRITISLTSNVYQSLTTQNIIWQNGTANQPTRKLWPTTYQRIKISEIKGSLSGKYQRLAKSRKLSTPVKYFYVASQNLISAFSVVRTVLLYLKTKLSTVVSGVEIVSVVENQKKEPVYNLTVEDEHEYYANGILVSNCHATMYYCIALEKALSGGSGEIVTPNKPGKDNIAPTVQVKDDKHFVEGVDLVEAVNINSKVKRGWK